MDVFLPEPQALLGTWRRFGEDGPAYEVIGIGKPDKEGRPRMIIRLPESLEELAYRLDLILDDPKEF